MRRASTVVKKPDTDAKSKPQPLQHGSATAAPDQSKSREMDLAEAKKITDEADHKKLESLLEELRQAIDKSQALKPFKDQLLLDITPEGLRIQIVDKQNRPMFDIGSARLKDYTNTILKTLAGYLNTVPNRISITGHTDIRPIRAASITPTGSSRRIAPTRRGVRWSPAASPKRRSRASSDCHPRCCSTRMTRRIRSTGASASSS